MMSSRRRRGGIGSVGSAMARFFHPRERIYQKWPFAFDETWHRRVTGATVRGEGMRMVGKRQQMCYLVTIPDIDDTTIFHIVKRNFKVDVEGGMIITETNNNTDPPREEREVVIDAIRGRPNCGGGGGSASLPSSAPPSSSSTTVSESLADFARDLIARTGGGIVISSTTYGSTDDVVGLCGFLVAKYAVADIAVPARMSPSVAVDDAWHRLMLFPGVCDVACRRAYEMAANIVVVVGAAAYEGDFAYDEFPGVVDHSPNAANDPPSAKEQRRRLAVWEMNRLGLSSSTIAPRASVCTPPALSNNRAPLAGSGNNAGDDSEITIRLKDLNGEETMFKAKKSTRFGKIMQAYAKRKGVEDSNLRFLLYGKAFGCMNGGRIVPTDTCAELGLVDGDQVDVFLVQVGC